MSEFVQQYLHESIAVLLAQNPEKIERCVQMLVALRARGGRLFVLGVGGSAANASHAVNDFRKLCGIEAYAPTDNVAELTARTNDDGWESTFVSWLTTSRIDQDDMLLVLSVGGGTATVSQNIVRAVGLARVRGAALIAVVGRSTGTAVLLADEYLMAPIISRERVTPHAEEFQATMWHLMTSHPDLRRA